MAITDVPRARTDTTAGDDEPTRTVRSACLDGNEAVARVAYALSEVIAIYPITPASAMGESADAWSAAGRPNLWGDVPEVIEMQSEAGAAGALHGAVTKGALGTTFTASQGLLLMLPNMFKIAGELTPTVIHVAARTVATHALSIFGDHSDVMAARTTGFAMLCASSVQEAQDFAAIAHAATLQSRVPFLHFFDGFRTSHEIDRIELLDDDVLRSLIDLDALHEHRSRGLTPDRPVLRGSAQNPDAFFQARESAAPFHRAVPGIVSELFDRFASRTGRSYRLVEYTGHPQAERVIVMMGSGCGAAEEAVEALVQRGARVGLVKVRLYRPFPASALLRALPPTVRSLAVLDRTKEPGAPGEPLYLDTVTALAQHVANGALRTMPHVIGGRYGLSSKEFTPAMAKAVLDELTAQHPRQHITIGIVDDVSRSSVEPDPSFDTDASEVRAVFFGLGSDGTVSANKSAVKIIGEDTGQYAQGYFVYDSKKSGSVTVSHLRFSSRPIRSTYLVQHAGFVGCHHFGLLDRLDVLAVAEPGATLLLNSPHGADTWNHLSDEVQAAIIAKQLRVFVIDADRVAAECGLDGRINSVLLPCFFALSGVLPREQAIAEIKRSFERSYGKRGHIIVERNNAAVDRALEALHELTIPSEVTTDRRRRPAVPPDAPDFVQRVTARLLEGNGDLLPVSAFPVDGTFPTATARYEKRSLATELPIWDPEICIDCAKCTIVCPHAAIRMKVFDHSDDDRVVSKPFRSKDLANHLLSIQVVPDDCTGCGVCVDVCPARSKTEARHKALNMEPAAEHRDLERERWEAFLAVPELDRDLLPHDSLKGAQVLEPLFEFSGACAGCGETPYLKLLTQLFGDRAIVANATGCSSIYGGNLPTTPWSVNHEGRGPAWSNSLFEDNAEFGLGLRLAADRQHGAASALVRQLGGVLGDELTADLLAADQTSEAGLRRQRDRVADLHRRLATIIADESVDEETRRLARTCASLADELVRRSVWIVGGDGWAYDIGFGGVDHVLASGRDVNLLVLDTEVYSNTGGQSSKATPRGAVAKFATGGKATPKKDLGMLAMAYGNVYVAQVAMGGNDIQTVKAFVEAEAWPGPSLIIAYSTCIAHGIDMETSMTHQKDAVRSGYWPLYRFHPAMDEHEHPFRLDSKAPSIPVSQFLIGEGRYAMLERSQPEVAVHLRTMLQADVDERQRLYEQLAGVERTIPHEPADDDTPSEDQP